MGPFFLKTGIFMGGRPKYSKFPVAHPYPAQDHTNDWRWYQARPWTHKNHPKHV